RRCAPPTGARWRAGATPTSWPGTPTTKAPSPGRTASSRSGSGGAASPRWAEPQPAPATVDGGCSRVSGPPATIPASGGTRVMACFRHGFPGRFGRNPTGSAAVAVVVGEEELLVERAVARLVAAASAGTGQAGAGEGPFPARSGVHEVSGAALGPGDLAALTAPSLFGGGCVVVIRDAHNVGKDVGDELTRLAAEPPP